MILKKLYEIIVLNISQGSFDHENYVNIGLLRLKFIHPLWKILEKCTTVGGSEENFKMMLSA